MSKSENLTDNDINILTLKRVSNHVYHLKKDMKDEFRKIDKRFEKIDEEFKDLRRLVKLLLKELSLLICTI